MLGWRRPGSRFRVHQDPASPAGRLNKTIPTGLKIRREADQLSFPVDRVDAQTSAVTVVSRARQRQDTADPELGEPRGEPRPLQVIEETPLGTGGAIKKALGELGHPSENVVVMNGDIITSLPLKNMVATHQAPGTQPTVTMALVPYKSRFGIVYIDKLKVVRKFEEKPEFPDVWINGGVYVIDPQKVMKHLPDKGDIERETFPKLVQYAEIVSYPFYGFWSLIDSIKDLHEVEHEMKALQAEASR